MHLSKVFQNKNFYQEDLSSVLVRIICSMTVDVRGSPKAGCRYGSEHLVICKRISCSERCTDKVDHLDKVVVCFIHHRGFNKNTGTCAMRCDDPYNKFSTIIKV